MKTIKVNPKQTKREEINAIVQSLQAGKIVLLPSDTVYGLSVRADQSRAIKKLRRFKNRPDKKPLLILVSSLSMLKKYFLISTAQAAYLRRIWSPKSRPTTVILSDRGRLPSDLNPARDGLAVRLPKSDFLIKIIRYLNVPLVSTSANLNGLTPISDPSDITQSLGPKKPQLIVAGGISRQTTASRLIDLRGYPKLKIIRK
jgi:L-threonylcarbamoyladenylate synthase